MTTPDVTVVIPTHNRWPSLRRLLDALAKQTYPLHRVEVIVVSNGCTDNTVEQVRGYAAPFALQIVDQPDMGPPGARNNGAAQASGRLLIFLDDDMEPVPGLIEAHMAAHKDAQVTIGYAPPIIQAESLFLAIELKRWWMGMFLAMRQKGHRFTYRDFLSGNFSIAADDFRRLGGFDTTFRFCLDDYEFGVRLLKAGLAFTFAENALAYHHETKNLDRMLLRKQKEGSAEVWLGSLHPEIKSTLLISKLEAYASPRVCLLRTIFVFRLARVGDGLAWILRYFLLLFEGLRLRRPWRILLDLLMIYWFWRGAVTELRTPRAWHGFLQADRAIAGTQDDELTVDLSQGIEAGKKLIEHSRPAGASLYFGRHFIGHLPAQPGVERLRAAHLHSLLATDFSNRLLSALLAEGQVDLLKENGQSRCNGSTSQLYEPATAEPFPSDCEATLKQPLVYTANGNREKP